MIVMVFNGYSLMFVDVISVAFKDVVMHTYHSRFIPERIAEASQIFLRDAQVLPQLFSYE
jgi:hypothetical protein